MDILLTGASGVIGTALTRHLARMGFNLHLTSRKPAKLKSLIQELTTTGVRAVPYALDLSKPLQAEKTVKAFFKKAKHPFGLVCNAGNMGALGLFASTAFSAWAKGITENFLSHAAMIHAFAAQFKAKRGKEGAVVVFSGAGVGGNSSFSNMTSYSTAKAAMVHLVEALSGELMPLGLTINAIAPGPVLSGMTTQALQAGSLAGEQAERARECRDSGGVSPELAAEAVGFLLGPDAREVTGRMLSARFDMKTVRAQAGPISLDSNLYRLRRIDNELYAVKPK